MGSSTADINRLQGTVNQLQQELDGATSELSTASTLQVHTPQTTVLEFFHPVLGWFHWPNDLCPTCNKEVEHRGVQCDICAAWYHYQCELLAAEEINRIEGENSRYSCKSCSNLPLDDC